MKILGIAGSPRRGGNTDLLLEQAMAGARVAGSETENIVLHGLNISPCRHCDGCQTLWVIKYVLKQPVTLNSDKERKGLFISVGGSGFSRLFQPSLSTVKSFFTVLDIALVEEITFSRPE